MVKKTVIGKAEETAEERTQGLVAMMRPEGLDDGPVTADVHVSHVDEYLAAGWTIAPIDGAESATAGPAAGAPAAGGEA